jgi:hypothetical protein
MGTLKGTLMRVETPEPNRHYWYIHRNRYSGRPIPTRVVVTGRFNNDPNTYIIAPVFNPDPDRTGILPNVEFGDPRLFVDVRGPEPTEPEFYPVRRRDDGERLSVIAADEYGVHAYHMKGIETHPETRYYAWSEIEPDYQSLQMSEPTPVDLSTVRGMARATGQMRDDLLRLCNERVRAYHVAETASRLIDLCGQTLQVDDESVVVLATGGVSVALLPDDDAVDGVLQFGLVEHYGDTVLTLVDICPACGIPYPIGGVINSLVGLNDALYRLAENASKPTAGLVDHLRKSPTCLASSAVGPDAKNRVVLSTPVVVDDDPNLPVERFVDWLKDYIDERIASSV